jgi:TRAP-type mannitol/chloroaromatic compound transport system permease large subunit
MEMVNFAPVMFAGLIVIMLIGFPVAFSLAALGLAACMLFKWAGFRQHSWAICLSLCSLS